MPGVAAGNASDGHPAATASAMLLDGLKRVGGAGRIVPTVRSEKGTDACSIRMNEAAEQGGERAHVTTFGTAARRVASRSSFSRLRTMSGSEASRAPGRLVTT